MSRERGIAMLEAALVLTVVVPVLVVCALVYEIGRLNNELREGVATALSELQGAGWSQRRSNDPVEHVLGSVTEKLKRELLSYDGEVVVATLTYSLTGSGAVGRTDFISADCGVFNQALCRKGEDLRVSLEKNMKSYLSEHLSSLTVRDSSPRSGEPTVVTLSNRLVGVSVRMRPKGAIWGLMGFENLAEYVDVVSPRQEVAF
jgi:hypothetical protein